MKKRLIMDKPNITGIEVSECLAILKRTAGPIVAAELADRLQLNGNRETRRRHIRAIIKYLREGGAMIVATLSGGYWLTDDVKLWKDYLEGRQIDAKKTLGETYKRKKMLTDSIGQGILFEQRRCCGVATQRIG